MAMCLSKNYSKSSRLFNHRLNFKLEKVFFERVEKFVIIFANNAKGKHGFGEFVMKL